MTDRAEWWGGEEDSLCSVCGHSRFMHSDGRCHWQAWDYAGGWCGCRGFEEGG